MACPVPKVVKEGSALLGEACWNLVKKLVLSRLAYLSLSRLGVEVDVRMGKWHLSFARAMEAAGASAVAYSWPLPRCIEVRRNGDR